MRCTMLRSCVVRLATYGAAPRFGQVDGDDARVGRACAQPADQLFESAPHWLTCVIDEAADVAAAAAGANVLRDHVGVVAAGEDRDVRCRLGGTNGAI